MTKSYFEKIEELLTSSISEANEIVYVAVAWFTNLRLLNVLCNVLQRGLDVKVLIIDDILNRCEFGLDFGTLTKLGADVRFAKTKGGTMHNKFCIIDSTVITGSYNWTYQANHNNENIIVTDDVDIVNSYCEQFDILFREGTPIPQPYEHLKWTDVKEGDFSEFRRDIYRDVFAQNDENTELKRIKLINLNRAYRNGNKEELSKVSSFPIEKRLRSIVDVLTSRHQDFKFKLWHENIVGKPLDNVDGHINLGEWYFVPFGIKEDRYHCEFIEGVIKTSASRNDLISKGLELCIYDKEFVATVNSIIGTKPLTCFNKDIIPDSLLRINLAKMFYYPFPSPMFNKSQPRTWKNSTPRAISAISVFGIVKEIDGDNVTFYEGWNPNERGHLIENLFFTKE